MTHTPKDQKKKWHPDKFVTDTFFETVDQLKGRKGG